MRRKIIVGDIHGCFEELTALLEKIGPREDEPIISLGDFIDRGPDSVRTYQFLRDRPDTVSLVGNHERKHLLQIMSYAQEITRLQFGADYDAAKSWLGTLPYFFEDEDIIVVHAAMIPGVPLEEQPEEILCGSISGERRLKQTFPERNWYEVYSDFKPVAFGHKVVGEDPLVIQDKIFGLDTGACHGGRLTALTVPDFQIYSVKAKTDHWKISRYRWQEPVLASKPWEEMRWDKIDQEIVRFQNTQNDAARRFILRLKDWRDGLLDLFPGMAEAFKVFVDESIETNGMDGFREIAKMHPLKSILFQHLKEEITPEELHRKFQTPADLREAATYLRPEFHGRSNAQFDKLRHGGEP